MLTKVVGTMWCFYGFNAIALISLPSAVHTGQLTVIINWVSSNWIQLILLPALMVGQNVQSAAADARAVKTFEEPRRSSTGSTPGPPAGSGHPRVGRVPQALTVAPRSGVGRLRVDR